MADRHDGTCETGSQVTARSERGIRFRITGETVGRQMPVTHWHLAPYPSELRRSRRSARIPGGRSDEQFLPVSERDNAAVGAILAILRLVAFHEDFRACRQRVLVPAAAQERVWCSGFDHPGRDFAIVAFHVDMDPRMGIDPFHLRNSAAELY